MFEKCIECEKLGKECHPNLYIMNMAEIRDFLRARKDFQGMTNADVAERSGIPKGTVDAFFGGVRRDVNYSTLSPILCALVGNSGEMPCSPPQAGQEKQQESPETRELLQVHFASVDRTLKFRRHLIITETVIICVLLAVILGAVIVDFLNGQLGYFWLTR